MGVNHSVVLFFNNTSNDMFFFRSDNLNRSENAYAKAWLALTASGGGNQVTVLGLADSVKFVGLGGRQWEDRVCDVRFGDADVAAVGWSDAADDYGGNAHVSGGEVRGGDADGVRGRGREVFADGIAGQLHAAVCVDGGSAGDASERDFRDYGAGCECDGELGDVRVPSDAEAELGGRVARERWRDRELYNI